MTKKIVWVLFVFTLICKCVDATDPPKKLQAQRLIGSIKIDGVLDDEAWKTAPVAKDFIEYRPKPGAPEDYNNRTEVYILYDNTSIYVGGYCHEKNAASISKELAGRDLVGSNDFVGIIFDTYNDKINGSGFYVTPLGEQYDAKYSNTNGEDASWNAVWYSESKIVKDGWTFEMRIPYSALRFSKRGTDWGLNIIRKRNKTGQQLMWNPVLPTVNGFISQEGTWTGVTNIKPPVRLSLSPYLSGYVNYYPANDARVKNFTKSINGGMDIKYGINQNYTLDMMLIPDFGQVQSDKLVLNTTPFETKYNENRPFFTEGTELFNKGGLFYSKRIGGQPIHKYDISTGPNEAVIDNPSETKLINATKISGRNQKGFGIGFFNVLTNPMYATIEDTLTGAKRKTQTSSLTNYNIIVFDQTLKNNSSVSLINTNTWRSGKDYEANVTAAVFDLYNKKSIYNLYGKVSSSNLVDAAKTITGYAHTLSISKTGGRFNFTLNEDLANSKYNISDLGYLTNNNYINHYFWIGYKWVKPHIWYNNLYFNFNNNLSHRLSDGAYQSYNSNVNLNGQLKNLWYAGIWTNYVTSGNDFYEPRSSGRMFKRKGGNGIETWVNTNSAKKYFVSVDIYAGFNKLKGGRSFQYSLAHRYRFNDKFSVEHDLTYSPSFNNIGYGSYDTVNNQIIFSSRKINTVDNSLNVKYNFTKNSGITVVVRHYCSQVTSRQSYVLNMDGSLTDTTYKIGDINLNLFNIDMVYTWQFAPGSFIYIVWKNAINRDNNYDPEFVKGYFKNFNNTLGTKQNNNLSVKIIYYLDYLKFRKTK